MPHYPNWYRGWPKAPVLKYASGFESLVRYMKVSKYKISENQYKCECGREFDNFQSLNGHFCHCKIHRELNNKDCSDNYWNKINHPGKMAGWENKSLEEQIKIHKKSGESLKKNIKEGKTIIKGHPYSENVKDKLREYRSQQLKDKNMRLNYSVKGCAYMNKLNEEKHWNLQHAENGGEVLCLGYWIDGYDKDLNIAFEYDEPKHYKDKEHNILSEYDIKRMNKIKDKLHCEFWRYNEYLDLLYKVD